MPKFFDPVNHPKRSINKVTIYGSILTVTGTATNATTANIYINGIKNETIYTIASTSRNTSLDTWIANNYAFYYAKGYICTKTTTDVMTVTPRYAWDSVNRINVTIVTGLTGDISGTLTGVFEPDLNIASTWVVTYGQTIAVSKPRNMREGATLRLELHATGDFETTWATSYHWTGSTEHVQTASGYDTVDCVVNTGFYPRVDTVTLAGTEGTSYLYAGGVKSLVTFRSTLNATCTDFVTAFAADYAAVGITVTATGGTANPLIFTATNDKGKYAPAIRLETVTAGLTATIASTLEGRLLCKVVLNYTV